MPTYEAEVPLTAGVLIDRMRGMFRGLPDVRKGGNHQRYPLEDAALGAFAVFFTQSPSFLDYQVRMRKQCGGDNAKSLFGIERIPCDQQIRNRLDPVAPEHLVPLLMEPIDGLYWLGALETHRTLAGGLLLAMDGSQYFALHGISCPSCSARTLTNGNTQYYYVAVTPVLGAPGQDAVFPLPPCVRRAAGWLP
jgi:hypothetical protein